jgi:hypothetical protein
MSRTRVAALVLALLPCAQEDAGWSASVGMPVSVRDLVLPGGALEPVPATPDAPVVVRMDAARPHGDGFRYDLEVYALEPGEYDLGDWLRARGSGATSPRTAQRGLPALPFRVHALLPPGQVEPRALAPGRVPLLGGYRVALVLGAVLWLGGLAGIVWLARRRRRARMPQAAATAPVRTRAEHVQALAARALAGELDGDGRAALERALIALWTERLALAALPAAEALAVLETHPEAGPVLAGLERWLHRPDAPPMEPGDPGELAELLAPYAAPHAAPGRTLQPAEER